MTGVVRARAASRGRTVLYAVGAAVIVLVLVAGLAFANSISVTRVTNNARSLHWANATMGTAALTRAGLVQALTFAELRGEGPVSQADFDFAMQQVSASAAELDHLYEIGESHDSYPYLAKYVTHVHRTADALAAGDIEGARGLILSEVEASYVNLTNSLQIEQEEIQAAIENNSRAGRALNGWVVFVLMLAVPGAAVAVYFVIARRQVRALRERNRVELEAEKAIGRAKDAFIAGLSHELRTPLTSIYGFSEILSDGDITGAEATRETAQTIANEAAEMTRMVDDLLTASRLDSTGVEIRLAPVRVQDVVDAAAGPFERAGMVIQREPTTAMAVCDAARLRHVLVNLLSNAARHGGPLTAVEVTTGGDTVDIEVWDNGRGVQPEREGSLFERFVHNGEAPLLTGSVGLGLAVANRLTRLMGGTLQYQRFANKTYFIVTLPTVAEESVSDDGSMSIAEKIRAMSS